MIKLFNAFFDICLLRSGPQDLPASSFFLGMVIFANVLINIFILHISKSLGISIITTLLGIVILVVFINLVLRFRQLPARINQTLIALFGTDTLIGLFVLPMEAWFHQAKTAKAVASFPASMNLLLWIWSLVVLGHILRHALSATYATGFGFAVIYVVISLSIIKLVFPTIQ